jgi:hypothetical protein
MYKAATNNYKGVEEHTSYRRFNYRRLEWLHYAPASHVLPLALIAFGDAQKLFAFEQF